MDILLDSSGDLYVSPKGDIALCNYVAQKIRIKLLWFAGEWKWDIEEGMPYKDSLLIKNPDTSYFEGVIRGKIFEIDEVTEIKSVSVTFDPKTRSAVIRYVVLTDLEAIKDELTIESVTKVKVVRMTSSYGEDGNVVIGTTQGNMFETDYDENGNVTIQPIGDMAIMSTYYKGGRVEASLVNR